MNLSLLAHLLLALGLVASFSEAVTKNPTRRPTRHPTMQPSFHPSWSPTTSAPTPSPVAFPYESCCATQIGTQPKDCFALTVEACTAPGRRALEVLGIRDEDDDQHLERRVLAKPGTYPCTYFFTTFQQLRGYVYGKLKLRGARAQRKIKGLFKSQGSVFCKFGQGGTGDCGCHSIGGWCKYKNPDNCNNHKERILNGGPNGETVIKAMCSWDSATSTCTELYPTVG